MSDTPKTGGVDMAELAELIGKLPQDSAGSVIEQLRLKVKANEAESARRAIIEGASNVILLMGKELAAVLPVGRALRVVRKEDGKGEKGEVLLNFVFDVDMGGGLSSMGEAKEPSRKGGSPGGVKRMKLDGAEITSDSWRSMLDTVNERLKAKGAEGIKVPTSSFNAREVLIRACAKVKGLEYLGEAEVPAPAPAPAPTAGAPATPPAPATGEGDKK